MIEKEKAHELRIEYEETVPAGLYENEQQHLEDLFIRAINFGKQLKANPVENRISQAASQAMPEPNQVCENCKRIKVEIPGSPFNEERLEQYENGEYKPCYCDYFEQVIYEPEKFYCQKFEQP